MKALFSPPPEEGNLGWSVLWFLLLIFVAKPIAYFCAIFFIMLSPLAVFVENEGFQVGSIFNIFETKIIFLIFIEFR